MDTSYPIFARDSLEALPFLLREGFAVFDSFLTQGELEKLDLEFETIVNGKSPDFVSEELPQRFHYYSFSKGYKKTDIPFRYDGVKDIQTTPTIEKLIDTPFICESLKSFYEKREYIYPSRITLFDTYGVPKPKSSESPRLPYDLHFDRQQTLKFFFYLTPANAENGPLCIAPNSEQLSSIKKTQRTHRESGKGWLEVPQFVASRDESEIPLIVPRGGMIALDSDLPHRQGPSLTDANRRCVILESQTLKEAHYTGNIKPPN